MLGSIAKSYVARDPTAAVIVRARNVSGSMCELRKGTEAQKDTESANRPPNTVFNFQNKGSCWNAKSFGTGSKCLERAGCCKLV